VDGADAAVPRGPGNLEGIGVSVAVPAPVRRVLEQGDLCHVVAATPAGPHVTPMVFATAGDRVWVTTSRGSVKARAWRADPRVAGMVRARELAVCFAGTVTTYDLLDPDSWSRSLRQGPMIALASARFTRKNARFFAGYAVDAHRVPLAWTPPGRVFAEITIDRSVVLDERAAISVWGDWGAETQGATTFRAVRTGDPPLARLPEEVGAELGGTGAAALGLSTPGGPVVLPARWLAHGAAVYAVLDEEVLALAGIADPGVQAALQIDRASWWRAREMTGAMIRGRAEVAVVGWLDSGVRSAESIVAAAGVEREGAALVRVRPDRLVWWRGWSSGTVRFP
jgi:hypothetical protein